VTLLTIALLVRAMAKKVWMFAWLS